MWFRCHRRRPAANNGAWWFQPAPEPYDSDDPGGRFDLHSPSGTCYVADSALTALWEFVGAVYLDNGLRVSETFLEGHLISALSIPHSEVAALLAGHTGMRGVTRELSTTADYDMCQSWAEAFHDVGLDGLRSAPATASPSPCSGQLGLSTRLAMATPPRSLRCRSRLLPG